MSPPSLPLAATAAYLLSLACAPSASARLGETPEQCAVRYGVSVAETKPLLPGALSQAFVRNKVRVRVEFLDGKAVYISFTKRALKSDERQSLLALNGGSLRWSVEEEYLGRKFWVAGDLSKEYQASEYFFGDVGVLEIAGRVWLEGMKKQRAVMFATSMTSGASQAAPTESGKPGLDPDDPGKPKTGSGALEGF